MTSPGTSQVLYVTYHGQTDNGSGEGAVAAKATANVDMIDKLGFRARDVLDPNVPDDVSLKELRAVVFGPDGDLWVVSGAATSSQILRFDGTLSDGHHQFLNIVTSKEHLAAVDHPFDLVFPPGDNMWFVSNQDTNVVAGPLPMANIPPAPDAAAYLVEHYPGSKFLPGTFVASAVQPPNVTEPVVPAPQGLEGIFTQTANHSVRGLAHDGKLLYVADEVANEVKGYDAAGQLCWAFAGQDGITIQAPVHLLHAGDGLFIGSAGNGSIVFLRPFDGTDPKIAADGIKQLSGIALDASGTLYYGSRKDLQVYAVPFNDNAETTAAPAPYGPHLPQAPEFVVCAPS